MAPNPAKPKKIAQQVGYRVPWWPGAESNQGRGCPILIFKLSSNYGKGIDRIAFRVVWSAPWLIPLPTPA